MTIYYTLLDIIEYINETEDPTKGICNNINHPEYPKYFQLKELYHYYSFRTCCKRAVNEFNIIKNSVNDLNSEAVRFWVKENEHFFKENIYGLGILFTDINHELKLDFYLPSYELYIEREPFIPLIQYWELMWNLTND